MKVKIKDSGFFDEVGKKYEGTKIKNISFDSCVHDTVNLEFCDNSKLLVNYEKGSLVGIKSNYKDVEKNLVWEGEKNIVEGAHEGSIIGELESIIPTKKELKKFTKRAKKLPFYKTSTTWWTEDWMNIYFNNYENSLVFRFEHGTMIGARYEDENQTIEYYL